MTVSDLWPFLAVLLVCLQCVIVVFPGLNHLLSEPNLIIYCSRDNGGRHKTYDMIIKYIITIVWM